ncbi:hypothetical protein BDW69DRAFT_77050 [Aspergillus filifer]
MRLLLDQSQLERERERERNRLQIAMDWERVLGVRPGPNDLLPLPGTRPGNISAASGIGLGRPQGPYISGFPPGTTSIDTGQTRSAQSTNLHNQAESPAKRPIKPAPASTQHRVAPLTPRKLLNLSPGKQSTQHTPFNPGQYTPSYPRPHNPLQPSRHATLRPTCSTPSNPSPPLRPDPELRPSLRSLRLARTNPTQHTLFQPVRQALSNPTQHTAFQPLRTLHHGLKHTLHTGLYGQLYLNDHSLYSSPHGKLHQI